MTSQTTIAAPSGHDQHDSGPEPSPSPAAEGASDSSRNAGVITAIRTHHGQLAAQLHQRTAAVVDAAGHGDCGRERDALQEWYRTELMPHVVAEEQALYSRGAQLDSTRLLVRGMLDEHRHLTKLVAELAQAADSLHVAATAVAAQSVFTVHLGKENDLLVPALDEAGVNLAEVLDGMHEILGHQHGAPEGGSQTPTADGAVNADGAASADGGCGCGCGHGEADGPQQNPGLQIGSRPPEDGAGLDVRSLPHGQRHEIIFGRLDALAVGQRLVIINDHDPKPLRYQASALWPDRFEWSYLEAGPEIWRVAISRVG